MDGYYKIRVICAKHSQRILPCNILKSDIIIILSHISHGTWSRHVTDQKDQSKFIALNSYQAWNVRDLFI